MEHGQKNFTSKDFYLSSCLLAAGIVLKYTSKAPAGFLTFHFDCTEDQANDVLNRHWSGKLRLPTKDVIEAIYQLKHRMRNGLRG